MSVRVFTNLEMMPGGVRPVLHCSQGDIRPFGFNIKWNGQAYNPEGLCVVAIVKKDGNVATVAGTIDGDKVTFETTPQMTVLDGDCAGIVTFVDGENPVSTLRFVLAVQKDPTVDAVDSETDPTGWQAIMEAALADAAAAAKAWAVGPNGSGEGTDDNNAKYWAEQSHADQIQADWDEADPTAVDYIKNKPSIPSPQVQSDWSEADPAEVDYIKNKPTIPDSADDISYDNTQSGLTATNVQDALDEISQPATQLTAGLMSASDKEKFDNNINYSTSETVIGTWVDGKPLYRKTISIGALPNATSKDVAHGIENFGILIRVYGLAVDGTTMFSLPHVSPANNSGAIGIWRTGNSVRIVTGTDRSSYTGYATLEYTKTTD